MNNPDDVLILGGGAIGLLEELGVPVDCIAGTSMGSLVGGLYAAGVPLEEMEQLVLEADWKQLFDDSIPRRERSYRRKQDDREGLATLGLGVGARGVRLAPGVLQGERILSLFQRKTLHVAAVRDFNRLPIPFRAVATDLNTGQPVELGAGSPSSTARLSRLGRLALAGSAWSGFSGTRMIESASEYSVWIWRWTKPGMRRSGYRGGRGPTRLDAGAAARTAGAAGSGGGQTGRAGSAIIAASDPWNGVPRDRNRPASTRPRRAQPDPRCTAWHRAAGHPAE